MIDKLTSNNFSTYLAYASSVEVPSTFFHASLGDDRLIDDRRERSDIQAHHFAFPVKSSMPGRVVLTSPILAAICVQFMNDYI